jgi:DNA-binding response OmpR family regulator
MRISIDALLARAQPALVEALERAGHSVEPGRVTASSTNAANATSTQLTPAQLATLCSFDVVISTSVELAELLYREAPTLAVIVFTSQTGGPGGVEARVRALDGGAADAIDAGFPMSQMVARVGAAGRRAALMPRPADRLEVEGCTIDLRACTAARDGRVQPLTRREVELVRWFARHAGRVVSRAELLEHVWNVSPRNDTRAVDVAIACLRAKLERTPSEPQILLSIKGAGYRWR